MCVVKFKILSPSSTVLKVNSHFLSIFKKKIDSTALLFMPWEQMYKHIQCINVHILEKLSFHSRANLLSDFVSEKKNPWHGISFGAAESQPTTQWIDCVYYSWSNNMFLLIFLAILCITPEIHEPQLSWKLQFKQILLRSTLHTHHALQSMLIPKIPISKFVISSGLLRCFLCTRLDTFIRIYVHDNRTNYIYVLLE